MRRFGIPPATAIEQAQKDQGSFPLEVFQPLPNAPGAPPYRATSERLGIKPPSGPRTFFVIGDSGGVLDPNPQNQVTAAMEAQTAPDFVYHVGDISYFNGTAAGFVSQFFEAYAHFNVPIVGIGGNHDGDPLPGSTSLDAWMATFCSPTPALIAGTEEYGRDSQTQPYCYWTLDDDAVTIIGCYSNVPSGGVIQPDQAKWLQEELVMAPTDRPLIVALHHPPYSADAHHGGSKKMGGVLDAAFAGAGRYPDMVLSGHVHNYQRFTRTLDGNGKTVAYIVDGASGYHNRHSMASGAAPQLKVTPDTVLEAFCADKWGFLKLTIDGMTITGEYVGVDKTGAVTPAVDTFTVAP